MMVQIFYLSELNKSFIIELNYLSKIISNLEDIIWKVLNIGVSFNNIF